MSRRGRRRSAQPAVSPHEPNALVASAKILNEIKRPLIQYEAWQDEGWNYYDNLGEYAYAVTWKSEALSRVRLRAAKISLETDEPEFVDVGDVAELVNKLAGGVGGQAAMMKALSVHLDVPGKGYVVGVQDETGEKWSVHSADELRVRQNGRKQAGPQRGGLSPLANVYSDFELQYDEGAWKALPAEALVIQVWEPHPRHAWRAMSPTKAAIPILREIDFYNRHIIATLLSRLAFNGFLLFPDDMVLPSKEQYRDMPDPFIAELVDIASQSIKNPGTASAAIPIPLKVPAASIDKIKHLVVSAGVDDKLINARDRAIKRLAATMNVPQEVVLGMADVNHWTAWQLEESAIKIHISPPVEVICHALTKGYLHPMMEASGLSLDEDGARYVIWYDTSELTAKPDLGDRAKQAYDDKVISDAAYRQYTGFTEEDAPEKDELQRRMLTDMLVTATGITLETALQIISKFTTPVTGIDVPEPVAAPAGPGQPGDTSPTEQPSKPVTGPPPRQDSPPQPSVALLIPAPQQAVPQRAGA
jgi:hypothetical protein